MSLEINYIKNNISKPYLKNIYNILFYESKTQIDFKIDLQYEDVSERNYVKTIYEIFDETNNS